MASSVVAMVGAVGAIVSGIASASNTRAQGRAQASQYNADAQAADLNAQRARRDAQLSQQVASENAAYVRQDATENARRQGVINTKALGSIRLGYAAGGVRQAGSALDVLEESQAAGELQVLQILREGQMRARNIELQGQREVEGYRSDAQLNTMRAANSRNAATTTMRDANRAASAQLLLAPFNAVTSYSTLRRA